MYITFLTTWSCIIILISSETITQRHVGGDGLMLSTIEFDNSTIRDLRFFFNGTASREGMDFNATEWTNFKEFLQCVYVGDGGDVLDCEAKCKFIELPIEDLPCRHFSPSTVYEISQRKHLLPCNDGRLDIRKGWNGPRGVLKLDLQGVIISAEEAAELLE